MPRMTAHTAAVSPIEYKFLAADIAAHTFVVECTVPHPDPAGQCVSLPTWIPGSYLIREFARHVVAMTASTDAAAVAIEKIDKATWRCAPCRGPLHLRYEVYAFDLSVRGAYLDAQLAFFNGTSVFVRVHGHEAAPCTAQLARRTVPNGWRVATALTTDAVDADGFGRYRAENYDELIDHPVACGDFALTQFTAGDVPHTVALFGRQHADLARLARDLQTLCTHHIDFFGAPAPMSHYLFVVLVVGEGYGGLEHRASTALLCSRDSLPRVGETEVSDGYREFLGLCSHEYFHAWNVKRIKPAAFVPYDLTREAYTRSLWAFEGITSYYDDLALVRARLIEPASYLELLARTVTRVLRAPGRLRQSLAESSFDAWIKFYRPDENTPNAVVSYYAKGALVALTLDLHLRRETGGRISLDDVMRALWREYGQSGRGVPEGGVEAMAAKVSRLDLRAFFAHAIDGTGELPLAELFADVGVVLELRPAESLNDKGGKPAAKTLGADLGLRLADADTRVTHVQPGGPAHAAGIAAGDVLLALDGLKFTRTQADKALARLVPGARVRVHAFRRDELYETVVMPAPAPQDTCVLTLASAADLATCSRRAAWLGWE